MRIPQISAALLFTLLLAGCQFHKTVFPPPYIGTPQEISTYEVKGLTFVTTVTFSGQFRRRSGARIRTETSLSLLCGNDAQQRF
jgi:hypothetical protein